MPTPGWIEFGEDVAFVAPEVEATVVPAAARGVRGPRPLQPPMAAPPLSRAAGAGRRVSTLARKPSENTTGARPRGRAPVFSAVAPVGYFLTGVVVGGGAGRGLGYLLDAGQVADDVDQLRYRSAR